LALDRSGAVRIVGRIHRILKGLRMTAATLEPRVRRFQGAGVEIVADEAGPADGTPVLLLHGGGQTRGAWGGAVTEGARRGYHMFNADLRGHGETGWAADGDYSTEAYVDDLKRLVEQLGQPPVIVGASMGGLVGLRYAGQGGALKALVLVDVAPRIEPAGAEKIGRFMRSAPNGFADLEEAADAVSAFLPHRPRPKDTSGLMKNLRCGADGRLHWHWDPKLFTGARRSATDGADLREAARRLSVPTLLVRGRLSDILSPEGAQEFLQLAPHAEFVDIAGADHMVAGDRNDAFNEAVFEFLDRRVRRGAPAAP
jgi:pimeloyl-ACP methyl ester carboxylesterase